MWLFCTIWYWQFNRIIKCVLVSQGSFAKSCLRYLSLIVEQTRLKFHNDCITQNDLFYFFHHILYLFFIHTICWLLLRNIWIYESNKTRLFTFTWKKKMLDPINPIINKMCPIYPNIFGQKIFQSNGKKSNFNKF